MKQVFPKEILEFTADVYRFRHRKKSMVIYAILLLAILGCVFALPFVRIPLYISSEGRIIREDSPDACLVAECSIQAGDIGLIQENTPVTFQIDAFDQNQWGIATGEILAVSRDAEMYHDQAVFRIRCSVNETYLSLQNGHRGYLRKGQTLTAHIQLTERSLFDLLNDQWHDWLVPNVRN